MPFYTFLEANKHYDPEWCGDADFSMQLAWWNYVYMLEKYPFRMGLCFCIYFYLFVTPSTFIELLNYQLGRNNAIEQAGSDIDELLDFISEINLYRKIRITIYLVESE
jgi:hypothetical protein